jgi:general secretion pathway protein I
MTARPHRFPKPPRARAAGFTLVEVMVALAIVAIALLAGLRATASLTRNAERQSDGLLAQLCAENALSALRLARQMPGVGDTDAGCNQAGRAFTVRLQVRPTPNPEFRRIDAQVSDAEGQPVLKVSTIMGNS